jgi:thiosulfate dehydrogenase
VSTYPKFRDRSGSIETISKRVNDCIERSLSGVALDTNSKEMKAILSYMHWVGDEIPKGKKPKGSGLLELEYLKRPANPSNGEIGYQAKCASCHGNNGEGKLKDDGFGYIYPPVWGQNSYNTGAGLYRLSRFAGYVKANMPYGIASYTNPQLSDEEAWDVAAYVNSQPRPKKTFSQDWPDISKKPIDHPFGPYSDDFSEVQHKYGPFGVIKEQRKAKK